MNRKIIIYIPIMFITLSVFHLNAVACQWLGLISTGIYIVWLVAWLVIIISSWLWAVLAEKFYVVGINSR